MKELEVAVDEGVRLGLTQLPNGRHGGIQHLPRQCMWRLCGIAPVRA